MIVNFDMIEGRRAEMNLPVTLLCRQGNISEPMYRMARHGKRNLSREKLFGLWAAFDHLQEDDGDDPAPYVLVLWKKVAEELGLRSSDLSDPGRRATRDPHWMLGALLREAGYWFMNGQLGLPISKISQVLGVPKQTVHAAIQRFEDRKDHQAREARRRLEKWWAEQ